MDRRSLLKAALALPPEERLALVNDIWDFLRTHPQAIKLTAAQQTELDRCWKAYLADPEAGHDWATVKARLLDPH